MTNARFATLHVLLVVPVPLSTTPVPLRKSRARHERESCVGRKSGGLPSAISVRPLRSGCDALCASLRSPLHFLARRPQTEAVSSTTNKNVFAVPFGPKEPERLDEGRRKLEKCRSPQRGFRQPTVRLSVRNRNSPLYPFLYPGTHFCSQKPPALANGKNAETIFNAKGISHFTPEQQTAKSGFLDFQSSALPTELPSQWSTCKSIVDCLQCLFQRLSWRSVLHGVATMRGETKQSRPLRQHRSENYSKLFDQCK